MSTKPWEAVQQRLGAPDLVERLAALPASELTSLLLEVASRRAKAARPTDLVRRGAEPFAMPCEVDQRRMLEVDTLIGQLVPGAFEAVELSPVQPLGSCAAVSVTHQNKILSALRNLEVLADPTNALALLAAKRRDAVDVVRLCTSARVVRTPPVPKKSGWSQHFRLWAFVTAGRDPGGRRFDEDALFEHLDLHVGLLAALSARGWRLKVLRLEVSALPDHRGWAERAVTRVVERHGVEVLWDDARVRDNAYYAPVAFQVVVDGPHGPMRLCDGGFTDWMTKLRTDRKERFIGSAIGTELMTKLFSPV